MRDRALGSTVRLKFTTTDSNGAPVAPSSAFAASDFRIYKDGSATEKATTNGITVTSPFDSVTGRHLIEIDTNNSTGDTGFWASGSAYFVELNTAKTVNSQSVSGLEIGSFSLELQTADVRKANGTAITAASGRMEVNTTHFGGTAGTFSSGRPEVNATHWGGTAVGSVTIDCNMAQISGDSVAADNAESFFDGTGYAGTNNVIPTVSTVSNRVTANTDQWNGVAVTGMPMPTYTQPTGFLAAMFPSVLASTTNITSASGVSLSAGSIISIQSGLASQTSVDTLASYVDTEVAAIKAKTDNLPSDPADASDIAASFGTVNTKLDTIDDFLDTEIAAIKAKTDNLPADPADASDIAASFASIALSIATLTAYVDTEVAAIKAKTDNLPTDPADQSAVEAAITAAASLLATAAELAKVPKVGQTHRFTQIANNSGAKTADVSISVIP